MNYSTESNLPPHVLIFPLPLQGHVNSMSNLAEILCLSNLHVTLILTSYSHDRLSKHASLESRFSRYEGFRVATIHDGLPDDHPRLGIETLDVVLSLKENGDFYFRNLMESTDGLSYGGERRRVTGAVLDGVFSFAMPILEEMKIPYVYFRTISACAFWNNFCIQELIDAGEVPLKGKDEDKLTYWKKKEMDLMVTSIPGMENILRRRDLSGICRVEDLNDPMFEAIKTETRRSVEAKGLILNTFEDLEGPALELIRKHIPNLYSIGPLHAHLKCRLDSSLKSPEESNRSSSFWKEDEGCLAWLDSQPVNSVVYVSFGSITSLTRDELLEFWYGLVNSGHRFLWVIRSDSIIKSDPLTDKIPLELEENIKARGHMVKWAPQQKVLAHKAIGAFFTHSGWNSILESIAMGVPMICWAYIVDQTTNSRFVSEVWKIGVDIKDTCDRVVVENAIKDVMELRRSEFLERARAVADQAKRAVEEGGSSYGNLNRFIEFLKSI